MKYAIARYINGISLNQLEYACNEADGSVMRFKTEWDARGWLDKKNEPSDVQKRLDSGFLKIVPCPLPHVVIRISGGMVMSVGVSEEMEVEVRDYDTEGVCNIEDLLEDEEGDTYMPEEPEVFVKEDI